MRVVSMHRSQGTKSPRHCCRRIFQAEDVDTAIPPHVRTCRSLTFDCPDNRDRGRVENDVRSPGSHDLSNIWFVANGGFPRRGMLCYDLIISMRRILIGVHRDLSTLTHRSVLQNVANHTESRETATASAGDCLQMVFNSFQAPMLTSMGTSGVAGHNHSFGCMPETCWYCDRLH